MRIGIFTESYPPLVNGVSTSVLMLKRALEKKGNIVYIVTVSNESLKYQYDENEKVLRLPSLSLHVYDYRFTSVYPVKAINKIKKMNLDVIHTNVEFTIGMFARIVSKQLGIPLVHTYHTMWEDYTHYVTKGNKMLDKPAKEVVKYLSVFWGDTTATELIVPTKKIYNLFRDKYRVSKNIHIVPTGIEVESFYKENFETYNLNKYRKSVGITKKDFVIITVSRIAKEKSIDRLIINHKKIIENNPNIKLLIVGDGPDMKKLVDLSNDLNLGNNVIFVGKVPLDEVKNYYQIGDIFVTASTTETQGLTVVEAMASSLPVVAVNDESFNNVIVDGLNGYLFEDDNEYVEKILKIYNDKKLCISLSKQSRILSEGYSSKYFAERILDVYNIAIKDYNDKNRMFINKIKNSIRKRKFKNEKSSSS